MNFFNEEECYGKLLEHYPNGCFPFPAIFCLYHNGYNESYNMIFYTRKGIMFEYIFLTIFQ